MRPSAQALPAGPEHLPHITELEQSVLAALWKSSDGNGHDFGLVEDCRSACAPQQLGGVISSLSKKGIIRVNEAVTTQSGRFTQTEWMDGWPPERIKALINNPAQDQGTPVPSEASVQTAASVSLDGPVAPELAPRINSELRLALQRDIMDGICFLAPGRMMSLKMAPQFQVWRDNDGSFGVNGPGSHRRCSDRQRAGQFAVDCADWLTDSLGPFEKDSVEVLTANAKASQDSLQAKGYTRGVSVMAGIDSESVWDHPTLPSMLMAVRYGNRVVAV